VGVFAFAEIASFMGREGYAFKTRRKCKKMDFLE
jgi:hypothetical protein